MFMSSEFYDRDLPWLIQTYFSDPNRVCTLAPAQVLMEEGDYNDRLYLVLSGSLFGYVQRSEGQPYEMFRAKPNMFVGVYSFFSRTYSSSVTVVAEEPTRLAYMEKDHEPVEKERRGGLFEQFMPVVISNLAWRQQHELQIAFEKERTLNKLIESEKLASLGQMAAGIAHELNNAISVLVRNTEWFRGYFTRLLKSQKSPFFPFYQLGQTQGRVVSSREARRCVQSLKRKWNVSDADAKDLGETGITDEMLASYRGDVAQDSGKIHEFWELGATLRDMTLAGQMASHVVASVRALAGQKPVRTMQNVNRSIEEALALLHSTLRSVQVTTRFEELSDISANKGELVQIWTNLIRNSVESLHGQADPPPVVTISTLSKKTYVLVQIKDNGPGIPNDVMPKIIQPNFTTKEKGLEFGLGLGLTIVAKIVNNYGGEIFAASRPHETIFTVKLPVLPRPEQAGPDSGVERSEQ